MSGHDSNSAARAAKQMMAEQPGTLGGGAVAGVAAAVSRAKRAARTGDAENYVNQASPTPSLAWPAPPDSPYPGGEAPGYADTEATPGCGTDVAPMRTFEDCLREAADRQRAERPYSNVTVKDQLRNNEYGLELVAEAARMDSLAQWQTLHAFMREQRSEIARIKMFLGIN